MISLSFPADYHGCHTLEAETFLNMFIISYPQKATAFLLRPETRNVRKGECCVSVDKCVSLAVDKQVSRALRDLLWEEEG